MVTGFQRRFQPHGSHDSDRLFFEMDFVNAVHHVTDEFRPGNLNDIAGRFIPAILVQVQLDGARRFIDASDAEMGAGDGVSAMWCHVFLAMLAGHPAKPYRIFRECDDFVKT